MVGIRVVVRRIVRGETGPSGGPALTDLLGICETWGTKSITIRSEDGTVTEIARADIVSGKPVPPRPSRFRRLTEDDVDARCDQLRGEPVAGHAIDVQLVGIARLLRSLTGSEGCEVQVSEPAAGALEVAVAIEGTPVARARVRHDDDWALVTDLTVEDGHRRRGVRRLVVAALAEALAERGLSVLVAELPADDAAARGLATALGFERHHTRG
ncbi:MAG: GNAT family N-acetyltransferase [Propionibacteriales bacterium]|nr:GNAT family N-acetyltransferase [Propionibacteriales bacterium]